MEWRQRLWKVAVSVGLTHQVIQPLIGIRCSNGPTFLYGVTSIPHYGPQRGNWREHIFSRMETMGVIWGLLYVLP
jgi:hypothetical protein